MEGGASPFSILDMLRCNHCFADASHRHVAVSEVKGRRERKQRNPLGFSRKTRQSPGNVVEGMADVMQAKPRYVSDE